MTEHVDAVVVGGGAAGLAAAVWLARYRRTVVVLDGGPHRNVATRHVHGYLGLPELTPAELTARGRDQVLAYPTASIREARATAVSGTCDAFAVATDDGGEILAHRLVLATGVEDDLPQLAHFAEHYGVSAFHCPACDGYEARDRDVVALGWDARLAGFAGTLLTWARSVTIVTDGRRFTGDDGHRQACARHGVAIVEECASELVGEPGALTGVRLATGDVVPAQLLFFSFGHRPRTELATALGCDIDDEGYVVVDRDGATTVPGVFAAGDVTAGFQIVQRAAGSGAAAGTAAALSFIGEPAAPSSPDPAPDVMAEAAELAEAGDAREAGTPRS